MQIGTLNGLTVSNLGLPSIDFTSTAWAHGSRGFTYALNTSNIVASPPSNTFLKGSNDIASWFGDTYGGGYYGAGITITSFNYNIFQAATVKFTTPPANTATTCSIFSYVYNEINNPGNNAERTGKYNYAAFCPIDDTFDINAAMANIIFTNPTYPNYFVTGFPLQTVIAYSYSNKLGQLKAYDLETSSITYTTTCTTSKPQLYYPNSNKQRASFFVSFADVIMAPVPKGYPTMRLTLTLPSTTVPSLAALTLSTSAC